MLTSFILFSVVVVDICFSQTYVGVIDHVIGAIANEKCAARCGGGQLATWSNQEEFDEMVAAAQMGQNPGYGVWVGIQQGADGTYRFVDGETCGGADCLDEFPNLQGADCGFVFPYDRPTNGISSGYVGGYGCPNVNPYVCECPPAPAPGTVTYVGVSTFVVGATANEKCAAECENGQLATWSNQEDFDKMVAAAQMGLDSGYGVWVGIQQGADGTYRFIDGETCGGADCRNEFPNLKDADCGFVFPYDRPGYGMSSGYIGGYGCSQVNPYVCECPPAPATVTYVGVKQLASWADASVSCGSVCEGGGLATWSSQEDYDLILVMLGNVADPPGSWVGLSSRYLQVSWSFANGDDCAGDCATLSQWQAGQPSASGAGEYCAAILEGIEQGVVLLEQKCDTQLHYICECPITPGFVRCPEDAATLGLGVGVGASGDYHFGGIGDGDEYFAFDFESEAYVLLVVSLLLGNILLVAYICYSRCKNAQKYRTLKTYGSDSESGSGSEAIHIQNK